MRILVVGGGSGGHVTPVLAVLSAIRAERPRTEVRFWCDRSFLASTRTLLADSGLKGPEVPVSAIFSGKLRRYHGIPLWRQLLDVPTTLKNLRDAVLIGLGFLQSIVKLLFWFPDVIFTKGGFVCLPVGLAARLLRIPLVIHDSDAHPGLTNRVLSRFASKIATGAPVEYYPYDPAKTAYVGIPISSDFAPLTKARQRSVKQSLGFDPDLPLILITGGGLGARRLNDAIIASSKQLLRRASLLHITGKINYDDVRRQVAKRPDYVVLDFVSRNMNLMLGAADLVIARAGATTMLELAGVHAASILVPNAQLTGDHQTKNARVYADADAAVVLSEVAIARNPEVLTTTALDLLSDADRRHALAKNIATFARPDAAEQVAAMLFEAARSPRP